MRAAQRLSQSVILLMTLGGFALAQPAPSETELGVPIYPQATFLQAFTEGPATRYLFGTNELTLSVARFYEEKTGKKPERVQNPDGMETYRFVVKGLEGAAVPELEVQVSHFPGGFTIPDERGETRRYATTVFISKWTK